MAALPYMQLYVADYLADTQHLTTEEHGAYLLLLFNYWQTGQPLRKDRLAFVARMFNERWPSVEKALKEFFHDDGENWVHFRVEADLAAVNSKSKTNSAAGKASAKARSEKKAEAAALAALALATNVATNVSTERQRNVNHTDTDTDTDTKTEESKTTVASEKTDRAKTINAKGLVAMGVPEQIAKDWLAIRKQKRAPLTETALDAVRRESEIAGLSLADAIRVSAERGWQGFKAEWLNKTAHGQPINRQQQIEDANAAVVREIAERERLRRISEGADDFIGTGETIIEGEFIHAQ